MSTYQTAPADSEAVPKGIPYIITNEAAERFSFYGMKGILVIFMTKYLVDNGGKPDVMTEEQAMVWYHNFASAVYFFPLIGAIISDWLWGKYRTILYLSIVYCLGHLSLAFMDLHIGLGQPRDWLLIGLVLIAVGSGGIKPCVSAHVGDQFGQKNKHLIDKIFGWFYFSINLGAFASTLLTPYLLSHPSYGPAWAFGVPGVLMGIATLLFWMGRNTFIHIPAGGIGFIKEVFSQKGFGSLLRLLGIYLFVAMFWALFDQTGSSWVFQSQQMDRYLFGIELLPSQIPAINPILILLFIPLFNYLIYPAINKVFPLTPLRKIGLGFFVTVPAFLLPAWIESQISAGVILGIEWQIAAYILITAAEVMVSITCLEFSYTQAPTKMKSFVMAAYLLGVSVGNQFVSVVNGFIQNPTPQMVADVPGDYVFSLTSSDGKKSSTKEITFQVVAEEAQKTKADQTVSPDTKNAPTLTLLQDEIYVGVNESYNVFSSLDKGDAIGDATYSWTSKGVELSHQAKSFTQIRGSQAGDYEVTVSVKVGTQETSEVLTVHVIDENLAPVINLDKKIDLVYTKGLVLDLKATGTLDPNGDTMSHQWALVQKPAASVRSTADISGSTFAFATNKINDVEYYIFFASCMLLTALLFIPYAVRYRGQTYIQESHQEAE